MKWVILLAAPLFVAVFFTGLPACTKHEVTLKSEDPIVIKLEARVDIYNHAAEIEDIVSGDKPLESLEEDKKENQEGSWLKLNGLSSRAWAATLSEKEEAIQNRRNRFSRVADLKTRGLAGENHRGYLEPRGKCSQEVKDLIKAENQDRKIIYQATANEQGVSLAEVEAIFAQLHRDRAEPGEWIQINRGDNWVWAKK